MASKNYTSARAMLVMLGMALIGGCGTRELAGAPSAVSAGELLIEWQSQPQPEETMPEVQVEIRGVEGDEPIRRRVELRAPDELQARLSVPPGVYAIRLNSAVLRARPAAEVGSVAAVGGAAHSQRLPPPQIVLVRAASTTRARVALATTDAELASWRGPLETL